MRLYHSAPLIAYGNFIFRYRNYVFPAVLAGLFLVFPPSDGAPHDRVLDIIGLIVALSGEALRITVIGLAYIKRGGLDKKVYADTLVTEGLFKHARNPLYIGNFLILAGLFLFINRAEAYVLGAAFFTLTYMAIVAAEEKFLRAKFGAAYDAYCAATSRWAIRFGGLMGTIRGMDFSFARVVAKEYGTILSWTVAGAALQAYETVLGSPQGWDDPYLKCLALPVIAAILFGITARILKKSGRLNI